MNYSVPQGSHHFLWGAQQDKKKPRLAIDILDELYVQIPLCFFFIYFAPLGRKAQREYEESSSTVVANRRKINEGAQAQAQAFELLVEQ